MLDGDLGAGKTQFVQGIAEALNIEGAVTSPTFNILLSYETGTLPLYHFDLYRLDHSDQLEDIGFFETLDGDGVSLIEWGSRFPDALPYGYLQVTIDIVDESHRQVTIHSFGSRARQLLHVWANDSRSRLMKQAGGSFA